MFKLEKVFQNDDTGYYLFINFIKSSSLLISIYIFSILEKYSLFEIFNFEIFKNSKYYLYSILISILFFFISLNSKKKVYQKNFISFLKDDISNFIIANVILFFIFFILKINFEIDLNTLYFVIYLIII